MGEHSFTPRAIGKDLVACRAVTEDRVLILRRIQNAKRGLEMSKHLLQLSNLPSSPKKQKVFGMATDRGRTSSGDE